MLRFCYSIFERCPSAQGCIQLKRYLKLEKPPNPERGTDLPVLKYPKKKAGANILYVWGLGEHGALGTYLQKKKKMRGKGDLRFRTFNRPLRLQFGEIQTVTDLAAGFGFSIFAVKSKGNLKVFGTGINSDSQLGYQEARSDHPMKILLAPVPIRIPFKEPEKTKVTGVGAGRAHSVIVTDLEGVFTLGNNAYGQCGRIIVDNEKYGGSHIVHNIKDLDGLKIDSVECGQDHTLFLTENGSVYSCGWSADGQTGLGFLGNQSCPTRVLGDIKGEKIVKLSSKSDCVLALNDKGQVFGWGNSEYCQILNENSEQQQVNTPIHLKKCEGFGKIVDVAAAGSLCMMLNEDGDVFTWGFGILGRGPEATLEWKPKNIPAILFGRNQFSSDIKVVKIFCGLYHFAAINNRGDIYIWGKNKGCCLGLGDEKDQFFPLRVSVCTKGIKMSLGVDHTLALCRCL